MSDYVKFNLILIGPVRAEQHCFQWFWEVPGYMLLAEARALSGPKTFLCPIILPYLKQTLPKQRVISRHVNGQTGSYVTPCMMGTYFGFLQRHTRTHLQNSMSLHSGNAAVTVRSIKIYTRYI